MVELKGGDRADSNHPEVKGEDTVSVQQQPVASKLRGTIQPIVLSDSMVVEADRMRPESRGIWRALPSRWLSDDDHSAASASRTDHDRVLHQEATFSSSVAVSSGRC